MWGARAETRREEEKDLSGPTLLSGLSFYPVHKR